MLDIRTPIGLMFLALGVLIGVYGLVTPGEMYRISLGINLNLIWGGCMAVFGVAMLLWQKLAPQEQRSEGELTGTVPADGERASVS